MDAPKHAKGSRAVSGEDRTKGSSPSVQRVVNPTPAKTLHRRTEDRPEKSGGGPPKSRVWVWLRRALIAAMAILAAGGGALFAAIRHFESTLPSTVDLRGNYHPPQVTRVLARDGTLLAELFTERRTVVPIGALPAHVKLAFLAAEDASFYEHEGVNYLGIARAAIVNLRAGRTRQGASTITQQVVRGLLLDNERTYKRKIREALLARRLEQELTKDEIFELYLNHVYFGRGRYGVEEAARDVFGKSAKDLTIAEAAMLAGVLPNPEAYSPRHDLTKALTRRAFVLGQMREKGFLNDAQYGAAKDEPVRLGAAVEASTELAPEAVEVARRMLRQLEPQRYAQGGFTITTTIDPRLQAAARKALDSDLDAYDKRHGLLGPLKAPTLAQLDKKGRIVKPASKEPAVYDGTPTFESHKILTGVVTGADDAVGTFDVRIGTVTGSVKLADYERYNPAHLPPSSFAPLDARVRVSLLAPVPQGDPGKEPGASAANAPPMTKVPLRLESGPEGALVSLDTRTRQVLALVGSYEAVTGGLDRATQAKRQPGSTFKPILYSYAIHSRRFTPATLVDVTPGVFEGGYKPSNYEGWTGTDPLRLREILANSVNIGAVRVLQDVGPYNVVEWAHALGIQSTMKPDLSLALGSYELAPIELSGAYATFAAGGTYEQPQIVSRIVGPDGKDVTLPPPVPSHRVLDEAEAFVTTNLLGSVIDHGTGARAKALGRPLAGKTGTSNASKDTWFAGYSADVVAVVWIGYDDGKPLGAGESGASTALPAWIDFMRAAHEHKPASEFPRPSGVNVVTIDARTGLLPFEGDTETMDEFFLEGTEPKDVAGSAPVPITGVDAGEAGGDPSPSGPPSSEPWSRIR
jgi:penicillin-binding protein 1A